MNPKRNPSGRRRNSNHPTSLRRWRLRKWIVPALAASGLTFGAAIGLLLPTQAPSPVSSEARRVAFGFCAGRSGNNCVIDGDTFILDGETVRLAGIDTPEIGGARCASERQRGKDAKERLYQILNSGSVGLVEAGDRNRDRYGRLLRDATIDGRSVSEWMMAEGHARRWDGRRHPWC